MLDNDEAGQKATADLARLIGYDRVRIANLQEKDACDELHNHGGQSIIDAIFNAKAYTPAGLMTGESLWDAYKERLAVTSVPYPPCMEGVNAKVNGMRRGEVVLFTSGTGSGKSTMMKEIMLHLVDTTDETIGLASLEETPGDVTEKLTQMRLSTNLQTTEVPLEQRYEAIKDTLDRVIVLDHQGAVKDSNLITRLKELHSQGCNYIILDHLTMATSEGAEGLTGNEATDKIMNELLDFVLQNNVWLGVISHLRKSGGGGTSFEEGKLASLDDMKGSGSIKQVAFDVIAFARNLNAPAEDERNTVKLAVLKSRFTGRTGPAGSMRYNFDTCRLTQAEDMFSAI